MQSAWSIYRSELNPLLNSVLFLLNGSKTTFNVIQQHQIIKVHSDTDTATKIRCCRYIYTNVHLNILHKSITGIWYILFGQGFSFTVVLLFSFSRWNQKQFQMAKGAWQRPKCLDKVAMSTAWSRKNCDKNICMLNSFLFCSVSFFSFHFHCLSLFSPTTTTQRRREREREGERHTQFNSICWANVAFVNRANRKLQNYSDIDWTNGPTERLSKPGAWTRQPHEWNCPLSHTLTHTHKSGYKCVCVCVWGIKL